MNDAAPAYYRAAPVYYRRPRVDYAPRVEHVHNYGVHYVDHGRRDDLGHADWRGRDGHRGH
jgi:hypothetical protein